MPSILATLPNYAAALRGQGHRPRGINTYVRHVRSFALWLDPDADTSDISEDMIAMYQAHLATTCVPATVHLRLAVIKSFCRFCFTRGYLPSDPATAIVLPKVSRPLPRALSTEELDRLHTALSVPVSGDTERVRILKRNRLICYVMLYAGLRLSEVAALRWNDVDLARRVLYIREGKGGKDRAVPVSDVLAGELGRVLPGDRWGAVCGHEDGRPLSHGTISHIFDRFLPMKGVEGVSAHRLRHTFATLMRAGGADLEAIRQALGHENLDTTRIYLGPDPEKIRDAVEVIPAPPPPIRLVK